MEPRTKRVKRSVEQSPPILNNKFEYFNNKPSQYYKITYSYYPKDSEPQTDSPYPTFKANTQNKTQLMIEVALKPVYLRYTVLFYQIFLSLSRILIALMILLYLIPALNGLLAFEMIKDFMQVVRTYTHLFAYYDKLQNIGTTYLLAAFVCFRVAIVWL